LAPADAATVESIGGPSQLPVTIEELRKQAAFLIAGRGATGYPEDEDLPPDAMRDIQIKAEQAASNAFAETIEAEIRRLKNIAADVSETIQPAPEFLDEGVTGIHELAERMADAKGYTIQLRDSLRYTPLTPKPEGFGLR
jgi:hypothetical protein